MTSTARSDTFYRLLEDWVYGIIDSAEFRIQAIAMGMPAQQFNALLEWLEKESDA